MVNNGQSYAQIKARLDQIVEAVKDDTLPLDEALGLYEEAVALGSQISTLIEEDILPADAKSQEGAQAGEEADSGLQGAMDASAEASEA